MTAPTKNTANEQHLHQYPHPRQRRYARSIIALAVVVFAMVLLVACAPKQVSEEATSEVTAERPALQIEWTSQSDCAVCHVAQDASKSAIPCIADGAAAVGADTTTNTADAGAASTTAASTTTGTTVSEVSANASCFTCHTDEAGLAEAHVNLTTADPLPRRLKATEVADETCLTCHFETREALVAATTNITPVMDSNELAVNPHNPGTNGHEAIACGSCHNLHTSTDLATNADETCRSCHHQNVFECYTCHP